MNLAAGIDRVRVAENDVLLPEQGLCIPSSVRCVLNARAKQYGELANSGAVLLP